MNDREVISEISARCGINFSDCEKVIRTLEEVLADGLTDRKWKSRTFDFIAGMCSSVRKTKNNGGAWEPK